MKKTLPSRKLKGLSIAFASIALVSTMSLNAQSESADGLVINPVSKGIQSNFSKAALNPFLTVNIGDSLIKFQPGSVANGNAGIAYLNGEFWVSKWASDSIFTMNPQGQVTAKFTVPGVTGIRSITTDGTNLYMGNAGTSIFEVNPVTKIRTSTITIAAGAVGSRMCTYDPTANSGAGGFWIANFTSNIVLVSRTGAILTTIPTATHGLAGIYGGAVDTITPGGPFLHVFNQGATGALERARIDVIRIPTGVRTGVFYTVTPDLAGLILPTSNPIAGGLFITDQFNSSAMQVFGVMQGSPDILFGYDAIVPNCFNPLAPTATNVTGTSAVLDWTTGGATIWNIEYGPVGFVSGTGTKISNITTKPYTLSGLTAGTAYEYRVEDSCGAANNSFYSVKARFTTLCQTIVAPYTESFNAATFDACLRNFSTSNELWVLSANIAPPLGNGPATDNSGTGFFAYVDDSESPSSTDVTLQLPDIDISALTNPELEFFHNSDRLTAPRNAILYVTVQVGSVLDTVFTDSVNTNGWKRNRISLANYTATQPAPLQIRFIVDESNGAFNDDIAIDDISVKSGASFDAEILAVNRMSEYTLLPSKQTDSTVFAALVTNAGGDTLRSIKINYDIKRGTTVVYSDSSTLAVLAPSANFTFSKVANFVPTLLGDYSVDYTLSHANVDATPTNNVRATDVLTVSDTTIARDNGVFTGSLGIGSGTGGELGSVYELAAADTLTSVSTLLVNGSGAMTNRPFFVRVRNFANGIPGSVIATSDTLIFTAPGAAEVELTFDNAGGYVSLPADSFFVGVVEIDSNVSIGTTPTKFVPNTNFVTFGTTPWTPNENFNFILTYTIRPNFGTPRVLVGLNNKSTSNAKFAVYPNPSNGVFTLEIQGKENLGNVQVEVYDITGKTVYNNNFFADNNLMKQVNLSDLNGGIYFLRTVINGNNTIQKITIK